MQEFESFLRSGLGSVVTIAVSGISFIVFSGIFFKKANFSLRALTYTGLSLSIAFLLSYITVYSMPQGGSVTPLSMFFVTLVGFWFGPAIGIVSGISYGLLQVVQGAWVIHPLQFLLDYPLAFGMLGLSGFFSKMKGGMYIGFIVGVLGRFVMSVLSGWIYWFALAPGSLWASMVYNGSYMGLEMGLTLVIIAIPAVRHALNHVKSYVVSGYAEVK